MIVDLALLKLHSRIAHDDDDAALAVYLATAHEIVQLFAKRPLDPTKARDKNAILITAQALYEDGASFSTGVLPDAVRALLSDRVPTVA